VVFADIDGKRLEAVRDLDRERERARTVVELCSTNASAQIGEMRWHLEDPVSCLNVLAGLYPLNSDGQVRWSGPRAPG
jgi:hypothetical protein